MWSVMIPTYNRLTYLEQALRSALDQDPGRDAMQIGVVDNCSTQVDTEAFIRKIAGDRVEFYRNPQNVGTYLNCNQCIIHARGHWVHLLHDDDVVLPGFYRELTRGIEARPDIAAAFCRHAFIDAEGKQTFMMWSEAETPGVLPDWAARLAECQRIQFPAIVVRRDVYEAVGGFFAESHGIASDWEMWMRIAAKFPFWYEPQVLAWYRQHASAGSAKHIQEGFQTADARRAIEIFTRYLPPERSGELAGKGRDHYAFSSLGTGHQQLQTAQLGFAMNHLREALKCSMSERVRQALAGPIAQTVNQVAQAIVNQIQQAQKNPQDQGARANLMRLRRELATAWMAMPDEQAELTYAVAGIGKVHNALAASLKLEAPQPPDVELIGRIRQFHWGEPGSLLRPDAAPGALPHLLAAMLYLRADQVPVIFDLTAVPQWLVNDYLRFMHEMPQLFDKPGEAEGYAVFLERWVEYLHREFTANPTNEFWRQVAVYFTQAANFIAFYFNDRNLRETYRRRGQIMHQAAKSLGHAVDHTFSPRDPAARARIRLGVLAAHFGPQTETFTTLPVYEHLDRNRFEIRLFSLRYDRQPVEEYCASRADSIQVLPNDIPAQVRMIRDADLDAIVIGTNTTAVTNPIVLLALHRLARVQMTCFSSPVTTGLPHLDDYVSGKLCEPPEGAQDSYTERLIALDGPGYCFSYRPEPLPPQPVRVTRSELNIPADAVVFASGANVYKIIPEVRDAWARIMAQVPGSRLVLYPFAPSWSNAYATGPFMRLMKEALAAHGVGEERILVLGALPTRTLVKQVLSIADVYLDSFPYTGANSTVDPLEIGLPPVLIEGRQMRCRQGPALLRELGIPELLAVDVSGYVELATRLGNDATWRGELRDKIAQLMGKKPKFMDSSWYSGEIARVLTEIV
jgi:predicted O-linked N-acetylglucosamine transferase (SPINDLY family)/glycosyltransferase involved in cell wall biosynthesis